MNIIEQLEMEQAKEIESKRKLPEFSAGDTVRVSVRVSEGTRTRIQVYEGVCIARKGSGLNESFCVRKISYGEGVERVFPLYSPLVEGVEVVRRGKVRRAKLYYLRNRRGKSARISENTGSRAKGLAEIERAEFLAQKERMEAEKIEAAEQLAAQKEAEEAEAKAKAAEVASAEATSPPADSGESKPESSASESSPAESKSPDTAPASAGDSATGTSAGDSTEDSVADSVSDSVADTGDKPS